MKGELTERKKSRNDDFVTGLPLKRQTLPVNDEYSQRQSQSNAQHPIRHEQNNERVVRSIVGDEESRERRSDGGDSDGRDDGKKERGGERRCGVRVTSEHNICNLEISIFVANRATDTPSSVTR